jgi:tight adherence protein C
METAAELLVPILVFFSVMMLGAAVVSARAARRRAVQRRLQQLERQFLVAKPPQVRSGLARAMGWIGNTFSLGKPSSALRQELAKAGYHSTSAGTIYLGAKLSLLAAGVLGAAALVFGKDVPPHLKPLIAGACGIALYFVPNLFVYQRRSKRTLEVRHHLPDVVDLLEICVASGMGLDMAWNSVADEIRRVSAALADEMALTNLEMHLGATRAVAMRHMAERTGVDELSSLVALLVQSERFGTSITDTLKVFAQSMREERSQHAQESAEKMAVKLLFPMVLFIFPAVLVVMVGPAAINLFKMMLER